MIPEDDSALWAVVYLDNADTDAEAAHRFLTPLVGEDKATEWLRGFYQTTENLANFPGPSAHPIDEEASRITGRATRKMLCRGGTRQKTIGASYRVYFYTVEADDETERGGIFILRVLHGAAGPWPALGGGGNTPE